MMKEGIGFCAHREVDMVVGAPWWCKLWQPDAATTSARARQSASTRDSGG